MIGKGSVIGEMALLTRSTRSATVYATRDSELVRLSHAAFGIENFNGYQRVKQLAAAGGQAAFISGGAFTRVFASKGTGDPIAITGPVPGNAPTS